MSVSRRHRYVLAVSATALALTGVTGGTQASAVTADRDVINKMSGGRLALSNDSTANGAAVITLRDPRWRYRTEAWKPQGPGWNARRGTSTRVLRNSAANKCLQPASATPRRGTTLVVRTCNGSDLQKWVLHPERVNGRHTGWWMWRPKVAQRLAMALNRYHDGSFDSVHLDTAYPSSDRLWRIAPNNTPWNL